MSAARQRRALIKTARGSAARALAERYTLLVAVPFYILVVSVLSGVWRVAAQSNGDAIAGYSAAALTWYIAMSEAAMLSVHVRMIDETGTAIGDGTVAIEMLRPIGVLPIRMAVELGRIAPRLIGYLAAGAVLCLVTVGAPPRPADLLLSLPSVVIAIGCNLSAQLAFAGSAFWLRDAGTAFYLYQKLVFILGGMLIPLEVFPGWLQAIAAALPFRAMAYVPARLAAGAVEPWLIAQQLGWLCVCFGAAAAVWAKGEQRMMAVGA